jgi:hypothetical protein
MKGLFRDSNMNAMDIVEKKRKRNPNFRLLADFSNQAPGGAVWDPHLRLAGVVCARSRGGELASRRQLSISTTCLPDFSSRYQVRDRVAWAKHNNQNRRDQAAILPQAHLRKQRQFPVCGNQTFPNQLRRMR